MEHPEDPQGDPASHEGMRRRLVFGGGLAVGAAMVGAGTAQAAQVAQAGQAARTPRAGRAARAAGGGPVPAAPQTGSAGLVPGRTYERLTLNGALAPEPIAGKTAGPIRPARGSSLAGKVAVITGAARGIGRSIAVEYAANGADVALIDIAGPVAQGSPILPATPADLAETVRQVQAYGRKATPIRADIRNMAELRAAADRVVRTHGRIDIVVANAAIQCWKPLMEMTDADWGDTIDNNLNGTANTLRAFGRNMVQRRQGRMIVLATMQARQGTRNASGYSASKWGILGLMKSAARELGPLNITVNSISPGLVATAMTINNARLQQATDDYGDRIERPTPQQAWDARKGSVPLEVGWLQPDDISPVAVFLASDAAAMVTGADYQVTGGDSALNV